MINMSYTNVLMQEFPEVLIKAIKNQKNLSRIFFLSKGSTVIYVITYKKEDKEIFNIISYEEEKISDLLKKIFLTSPENRTLFQKSAIQKIQLFMETLFTDFNLDIVEIDGNPVSIEEFKKDSLKTIFLAVL